MHLLPIPAFDDNYLWLLHDGQQALVVDPGDAAPVQATLAQLDLDLVAILVTHHHGDHTGGVLALQQQYACDVYYPANEQLGFVNQLDSAKGHAVRGSDTLNVLGTTFTTLDVPGHTLGHVAFHAADVADLGSVLFCGDTLFSGGCGRLFEGTPAQMRASLAQLAALPPQTWVCCAHEYTLSNLKFARAVDPQNQALLGYSSTVESLRAKGLPTLPVRLGTECEINPFLRVNHVDIATSVLSQFPQTPAQPDAIFGALRAWKNNF
ncbi:hydroxyacylglutathione hydrolase [Comamonadaceae bacterium M7527]|nr:hydroxyacylglutathione hydrolase [Comamonadaceae bacterium M7527]